MDIKDWIASKLKGGKRSWSYQHPVRGEHMFFVGGAYVCESREVMHMTEIVNVEITLRDGLYIQPGQQARLWIEAGQLQIRVEDMPPRRG